MMRTWVLAGLLATVGVSAAACEKRERSNSQEDRLKRDADKAGDKASDEANKLKDKVDD